MVAETFGLSITVGVSEENNNITESIQFASSEISVM